MHWFTRKRRKKKDEKHIGKKEPENKGCLLTLDLQPFRS